MLAFPPHFDDDAAPFSMEGLRSMTMPRLLATLLLVVSQGFLGFTHTGVVHPPQEHLKDGEPFRVLVFSRTAGFRHDSIPDGVQAIRQLGEQHGFHVEHTEDSSHFTDENLKNYAVVVFLSTTGDVLNDEQERAFERFIQQGHGYVGIHAAADTEYDWPWYGQLVGAYFKGHPAIQPATIQVADPAHPSTRGLDRFWKRTDEWYTYRANPRGSVHVLMTLDERTYQGGGMGADHPIAWCHEFDGGRAWYTGLGHTRESYREREFLDHILGGIRWAAGVEPGDAGGSIPSHFEKVVLDANTTDPMELAVASDGRVVFVERGGVIKVWDPALKGTVQAGYIPVSTSLEDGLLGVTLDPSFDETGWIYVYYSPAGDEPVQHLSRLTLTRENTIVPDSERILLKVPTQREECCHSGGSLAFGPDGTLYISTGDNTNPFASDGYAPIDTRDGRHPWDAQKSSANANDLRGKILRIRPLPDGTYEIPDGNLFPKDGSQGRPEIYVMGCRNPFRISIDPRTGFLYWGDVGPDASAPRAQRGPAGHDEWNQARGPGNFGWPHFVGPNLAYHQYDFATNAVGEPFDPARPVNTSPFNTGPQELPPAVPAWIWYTYGESAEWPELGAGGRCAMAGPVFHYDPDRATEASLPASFDNTLFIYEWARNWIMAVHLDDSGNIVKMNRFMPDTPFIRPHELELGPDGCLYLIEWGTGFGGGNDDAVISRLEYCPGGLRPPRVEARALPASGQTPLTVAFTSKGSAARNEESILHFAWDFDGDGTIDATSPNPMHTYQTAGNYHARLKVTDAYGRSAIANIPVSVGNTAPRVDIVWPPNGGVFTFGDEIEYEIQVSDREDQAIDTSRLVVQPALGHDTHAHPFEQHRATTGRFQTLLDDGHGGDADLFQVLSAAYTDGGAPGVKPITSRDTVILQPRRKQAQFAGALHGATKDTSTDAQGGGQVVVFNAPGAAAVYEPVNFHRITAMNLRVAATGGGGTLELRLGTRDGMMIAATTIASQDMMRLARGPHPIRIEHFENEGGAGLILRIAGENMPKQVVPEDMFTHDETRQPGLRVDYYALEAISALPDFTRLRPYKSEIAPYVDFPSTDGEFAGSGLSNRVGSVFTGFINIPADGAYQFFLESDDGSRLTINGETIITNDGIHAMVERSGAEKWIDVRVPIADPGGSHALWIIFRPARDGAAVKLNWIEFEGDGVRVR